MSTFALELLIHLFCHYLLLLVLALCENNRMQEALSCSLVPHLWDPAHLRGRKHCVLLLGRCQTPAQEGADEVT